MMRTHMQLSPEVLVQRLQTKAEHASSIFLKLLVCLGISRNLQRILKKQRTNGASNLQPGWRLN
jgi:hypothetical protein